MSKCVAEQFAERILSLELVDPRPDGTITISPLPTMDRQVVRTRLSQALVDYARWAKDIEHAASLRKVKLSELAEDALETMIKNLQANVELTIPRRQYADVSTDRLKADYALVQAGFAVTSRRLDKLKEAN